MEYMLNIRNIGIDPLKYYLLNKAMLSIGLGEMVELYDFGWYWLTCNEENNLLRKFIQQISIIMIDFD